METGQERFPEYAAAFVALAEIVEAANVAAGATAGETTVYVFGDEKIGVRIAEISSWWPREGGGGSGASFMRSEPEHGNPLLAAESFLLDFGTEPEGWDEGHPIVDYANESRWRLVWALTEGLSEGERDVLYAKVAIPREAP